MKNKSIDIFLIDDEFPKTSEFTSASIYDSAIHSDNLYQLAISQSWKGLQPLQKLIKDIVTSNPFKENHIQLTGYTKPTQCLTDIENGIKPDLIIYDWEYGMPNPSESQEWLLDILSKTKAFVFIYSKVRDEIPQFLNKKVFDEYASRFQLFEKGNTKMSIFSSEEFIFQYILNRLSNEYEIIIQGERIQFKQNGFLKKAEDILYLEKILGKKKLLQILKEKVKIISDETLVKILSEFNEKIYFDELNNLLITADSKMLITKYKPEKLLTYLEVVKQYGIKTLASVLEIGIAKI